MASSSNIEWTDATWNPIVGCSIVSPGCTNCYAMRMAYRLGSNQATPHYFGLTKRVNGNAVWTGKIKQAPDSVLLAPLHWRKPRMVFVNSMGDLFHESIDELDIAHVFGVMTCAVQHTYQVLTKRAERMRDLCSSVSFWDQVNAFSTDYAMEYSDALARKTTDYRAVSDDHDPQNPPSNVWLGVSAERQQEADERIPLLLQTPAAVRFVSLEPLLGAIDLTACGKPNASWHDALIGLRWQESDLRRGDMGVAIPTLDWVIVGGESGPHARPMHPDWARSLRDQCAAAGVPFFFKQWGEWAPDDCFTHLPRRDADIHEWMCPDSELIESHSWRYGKKRAGRLLDGKEHSEFPSTDQTKRSAA